MNNRQARYIHLSFPFREELCSISATTQSSPILPYAQEHLVLKFNTIGLFTDKQPQMVAFYRDLWGFETT